LEIFLIDTEEKDIPRTPNFEIETIKYLRKIRNFNSQDELAQQIGKDVEDILHLS
jgi:FAD synthase